jgi:hypothetical protein
MSAYSSTSAYITTTDCVIEKSFCQIHTHNDGLDLGVLKDDEQFGILSMKMKKTKITERPTMILFSVDNTASMEEKAYGNTTKMEVVIKTLKNIMTYLSTIDAPVYIQLYTFNLEVRSVIDTILVNKSNVEELINKIEKIAANNSTDIGHALKCANENMTEYHKINPTHQIIHIFMTDGEPTSGECNCEKLSTMVNNDFPNIFVGFGEYHNVNLLKKLSDNDTGDYQFVDNMENTSLIYGETLHRYLYPALQKVEINVENGTIYNWKTNSWVNKLYEPVIVGDIEKIYHIKTIKPYDFQCNVFGVVCSLDQDDVENGLEIYNNVQHVLNITVSGTEAVSNYYGSLSFVEDISEIDDFEESYSAYAFLVTEKEIEFYSDVPILPQLIDKKTETLEETNLAKYLYRQKTQELLYKVKESKDRDDNKIVKREMNAFFKNMRKYMKTTDLLNNKFMKNLCDDICITYRTIGTHLGAMYNISRLTTQSRQQTYSASPKSSNSSKVSDNNDTQIDDTLRINTNDGYRTNNNKIAKILPRIADAFIQNFPDIGENNLYSPIKPPQLSRSKTNDFVKDYSILKQFRLEEKMDDLLEDQPDDDNDIKNYNISTDTNSCYATESSVNTMTQISNL